MMTTGDVGVLRPAPALGVNPYVGPRPFEQDESKFFFGRDEETKILSGLVVAHQLSLFYAQSGAGKSSLLRAGLLPRLTRKTRIGSGDEAYLYQTMQVLPIVMVGRGVPPSTSTPISNIFSFSAQLALLPSADPNDLALLTLVDALEILLDDGISAGAIWEPAQAREGRVRPPLVKPDTALLIFDQFEEIFTVHPERWREREDFFRQVDAALTRFPTLHILFTMREDYLAELTPYANLLTDELRHRFRMERLRKAGALLAVTQPAAAADPPRTFAPAVAEELVDNLRRIQRSQRSQRLGAVPAGAGNQETAPPLAQGEYIEPVHLQIVCRDLWAGLPPDRTEIQASDLASFGDVDQALTNFYKSTLAKVIAETAVSERTLRRWFNEELITPARTKGLVYRDEEKGETAGLPNAAVDILRDAWIIRSDIRGGDVWYELAHDRLVEPILQANFDWQASYENPVAAAYARWVDGGQVNEQLLTTDALTEAATFADTNPLDITDDERTYLKRSQEHVVELQRQGNAKRRSSLFVVGAILAIIGLIISALLINNRGQSERIAIQETSAAQQAIAGTALATAATKAAVDAEELAVRSTAVATTEMGAQQEAKAAQTAEANAVAEATKSYSSEATAIVEKENALALSTLAVANAATANTNYRIDGTLIAELADISSDFLNQQVSKADVTLTPLPSTVGIMSTPAAPLHTENLVFAAKTAIALAGVRTGRDSQKKFVTHQGNQFLLNGKPFSFIGVSIRGLIHFGDQKTLEYSTKEHQYVNLDAAAAIGVQVVQVQLSSMHASVEETAARLQNVLQIIHDRHPNLYLLPIFANTYSDTPFRIPGDEIYYARIDPNFPVDKLTNEFYSSGYLENYLPFVEFIVKRFRDEPNIFAWQLGADLAADDPDLMIQFLNNVAKSVKTWDPNHLVTTGLLSTNALPGMGGNIKNRLDLYSSPHIDFVKIPAYNLERSTDDSDLAHLLNKPFIIEAGFNTKLEGRERAELIQDDLQHWFGNDASGYIQWGFMATNFDNGDGDVATGMDRRYHADWDSLFCIYHSYAVLLRNNVQIVDEKSDRIQAQLVKQLVGACHLGLAGMTPEAEEEYQRVIFSYPELATELGQSARQLASVSIIDLGKSLAESGNIISATLKFQEAIELNPSLLLEPELEVKRLTAPKLVRHGRELAERGDLISATLKFEEALALDPALMIEPEQEAKRLYASAIVEEGRSLAQIGKVISATLKFEEAVALDPSLDIEPEQEAKRLAAPELVRHGRELAERGDLISATLKFEEALALDPALMIEPEQEAKRLYASAIVEEGRSLAQIGKVISATLKFEEAVALDPSLDIEPEQEAKRLAPQLLTIGVPVTSTTEIYTSWSFTGTANQVVTIALVDIEEGDFDPYLTIIDPNGETLEDDDSGGGHDGYNALLEDFTLPADGTYIIITGRAGSSAVYELLVTAAGDE